MKLRAVVFGLLLGLSSSFAVAPAAHGGSPVWRGPGGQVVAQEARSPSGGVPSVGMPARWNDVVLEGTELEALVKDKRAPLALRIVNVRPHGEHFRYDFEYWGLEPGEHDLRTLLARKDGSSTAELPPLLVKIDSAIGEPGLRKPSEPASAPLPKVGGYEALRIVGGVVWFVGLFWLVLAGRKRRAQAAAVARPRTLAERLQPLVERAMRGELSREERGRLELSLVALWRRRLKLEETRPGEVLSKLRTHPEAGPLLRKLEEWLHRPDPRGADEIPALLAPYRSISEDALDAQVD